MNKRRVIEAGKNLLIVGLTCSALWLASQSPLLGQLPGVLEGNLPEQTQTGEQVGQSGSVAVPLRMAVMNAGGCCAVQYTEQLQSLFSRVAPVLGEVLSAAGAPEQVDRARWEAALITAPGAYFDFQTGVPFPVLTGWLSDRSNPQLSDAARHILLSGGEQGVQLYYRSARDGEFYVCSAPSVNADYLKTITEQEEANGAIFAYQSIHYEQIAPDTLIDAQTPTPRVFSIARPSVQEDGRLEELLERLSFPVGITAVYETPEGLRARSGNDTLSILNNGTVVYAGEEDRYGVVPGESAQVSAVESARELVCGVLEPWCGQARVYLSGIEEVGQDSWLICFGYALDNIPVRVGEGGYAARVLVKQGYIRELELRLRTYTALDSTTLLLPARQAAAILADGDRQGSALELCYQESGDTAVAGWVAGEE